MVEAYQRGEGTYDELAQRFAVGVASVSRWMRRYRETGSVEPEPHAGGRVLLIDGDDLGYLDTLLKAHPDWTEAELAKQLKTERRIEVSIQTVGRAIRRLGYSSKKRPSLPRSGTAPTSVADAKSGQTPSEASPLRVWFLWTKPARTSR